MFEMSRKVIVSTSAQNGSLTSEPDSMNQNHTSKTGPERPREGRTSRSKTRQDSKGPDTSTPVKTERLRSYPKPNRSDNIHTDSSDTAVRRNLEDELTACYTSGSVFEAGGSIVGGSIKPLPGGNERSKVGSNFSHSGNNYSELSTKLQDHSTFATSPTKKSFVSEFENGTIQAQRQELQLLMTELKDRDCELNDMVRSHHEQLHGWEEDRERLVILKQKYGHAEGEIQRKNDQIRALVARLKGAEATEKKTKLAFGEIQSQLSTKSEQFSQTQNQLTETRDKNQKMGNMIKDLSSTLGKLESKEQELLMMLQQKDKDLVAATNNMAALSNKFRSLETKYKQTQRELDESKREQNEVQEKLLNYNSEVEKLKNDLDRSRQEEDETKMELERGKREVEKMKVHVKMMYEKEKRQEELISSQRKKQERTDLELSSLRQLYERQQRDMSLLHHNLESTKELLIQQQQNNHKDQCNISLLLQSPTHDHPFTYSSVENQLSLRVDHTTQRRDSDTLTTHHQKSVAQLNFRPSPAEGATSKLASGSDTGYVTGTPEGGSSDLAEASKRNSSGAQPRPESRSARSGIPVRIDANRSGPPSTNTPTSQLNESIKGISEQSKKLAQIIEASRIKRAEDSNLVMHELAKHLALSQESASFSVHDSQISASSDKSKTKTDDSKTFPGRHYSYPYNGHYKSEGLDTSGSPELQRRKLVENSNTDSPDDLDVLHGDGFATPPRTSHISLTTPSPQAQVVHYFSPHERSQLETDRGESQYNRAASPKVSFQEEYPEQTSHSFSRLGSQEGSYRAEYGMKEVGKEWNEGPSDIFSNGPASPGLSSIRSEASHEASSHGPESPTSKLHRLLTESRQMVISLERSTYPPFIQQGDISPIKADEDAAVEDT